MAKDVSSKPQAAASNFGDTSPSLIDSQKVPPLRIVLNSTAGNQKAAPAAANSTASGQSAAAAGGGGGASSLQQDAGQPARAGTARAGKQDSKQADTPSSTKGGRFRIKLAKQQSGNKANSESSPARFDTVSGEKQASNSAQAPTKEAAESTCNPSTTAGTHPGKKSSNYLRRITRRSQRAVQVISNEDEESISSMTSTDENQNTQISNSDSNPPPEQSSTATTTTTTTTNTSTTTTTSTNGASSAGGPNSSHATDTPRKYKKRRNETSECLTSEQLLFGLQNYSVPMQNSFKLFKNIRQQVDKKLDLLNTTLHPKAPRGFREYMLAKGAYILDGNRLGNGSNLTMNDDGGLNMASVGRFNNARRSNKLNYFIPDRAKVPLDIPYDSPLRDLFVEQEKERYRMRIQHIKEREKLTLAAEQEIMRVYNQAAMASLNQAEPLSACTMLKHQEIYNYMDSDGVAIQANEENESQDETSQEGVKTRRRQHEHVSPPQVRKPSNVEDNQPSDNKTNQTDATGDSENSDKPKDETEKVPVEKVDETKETVAKEIATNTAKKRNASPEPQTNSEDSNVKNPAKKPKTESPVEPKIDEPEKEEQEKSEPNDTANVDISTISDSTKEVDKVMQSCDESRPDDSLKGKRSKSNDDTSSTGMKEETIEKNSTGHGKLDKNQQESNEEGEKQPANENITESSKQPETETEAKTQESVEESSPVDQHKSETELHSHCKEVFVVQLQDIDDKWEKIRAEMLIRHRNEAESLHAVQRLEWEWKTKEIGAIDVRSTPVIDDVLVPKLAIYSQDY